VQLDVFEHRPSESATGVRSTNVNDTADFDVDSRSPRQQVAALGSDPRARTL